MIRCTLTKLSNNKNALRTKTVEGTTGSWPPMKGERFVMLAPPLEAGSFRMVKTSEIQRVLHVNDNETKIITENSIYHIVRIKDANVK
jgi:hypothetical protein